jgi:hypothetical protein
MLRPFRTNIDDVHILLGSGKREPLAAYRRGEGWGNVACA